MKRQTLIRICAAGLAAAGLAWCIKAGTIIVTGYQPPLTFELGQLLFPVGVMGAYLTIDRPQRAEKTGLMLAILGLVGTSLALFYQLLPGARVSSGEEFLVPYSLFVLIGGVGGFAGLVLIGIAILRTGHYWTRWRKVPMIVALVPLPLAATAIIHFELPIFSIGIAWLALAYGLWRVANA